MKTKPVALADRLCFVSIFVVGWSLLGFLLYLAFDTTIGIYMSSNPLHRPLMYATMIIAFAFLQRHLITGYLRSDFRHWLRWSIAGVIFSAICYQVFTALVPPPSEFWWYARVDPPPPAPALFVEDLYHAIRWFFRFGLVAFFQYFALPRHSPGRRIWLLTAVAAAPLWFHHALLAVLIQALVLIQITTGIPPIPGSNAKAKERPHLPKPTFIA